MKLQEESR